MIIINGSPLTVCNHNQIADLTQVTIQRTTGLPAETTIKGSILRVYLARKRGGPMELIDIFTAVSDELEDGIDLRDWE